MNIKVLSVICKKSRKVLALASGGGHWIQLLRLRPAFRDCIVIFASTRCSCSHDVPDEIYSTIPDASRWDRMKLIWMALKVVCLVVRVRPNVIVSTGAAPGYIAIRVGKLLGCRTIWLDSIANSEELSLSGKKIGKYADLWLTQWPHLAKPEGPKFMGAVL